MPNDAHIVSIMQLAMIQQKQYLPNKEGESGKLCLQIGIWAVDFVDKKRCSKSAPRTYLMRPMHGPHATKVSVLQQMYIFSSVPI